VAAHIAVAQAAVVSVFVDHRFPMVSVLKIVLVVVGNVDALKTRLSPVVVIVENPAVV
jgi:hypothetical protein